MAEDGAECGNCATVNIVVTCALPGGGRYQFEEKLYFLFKVVMMRGGGGECIFCCLLIRQKVQDTTIFVQLLVLQCTDANKLITELHTQWEIWRR